jgi:predicted alpha/beta-fold hydrolase
MAPLLDFRPLPLLGNPHVQTLLGSLWKGRSPSIAMREQQVLLPDGDRLVLHDSVPPDCQPGGRIALLVHGLGGSHRAGYMQRFAGLLLPRGVRVVRMDLRGVGRGEALARRTYHGGCSDDVRAAVAEIHRWSPASPLLLIGLSLGGNIVLKLAGEADLHPVPGLDRVAAVSPPIDMVACAALIAQPRNRFYEQHYVRALVSQTVRHQQFFRDVPPIHFPSRLTLRQFDELYTAPRWDFAGALDYYRRASSLPLIPRIRVPAFLLTARDDPFIDIRPFENLAAPPHVEVHITRRGGHLGFLGWDGAGGIRWGEQRVVHWLLHPGGTDGNGPSRNGSTL